MSFLGKEYQCLDKEENFEGLLKFVGIPDDKIKALSNFKPSMKLVQNGDSYTYYWQDPEGPRETIFKSGVEFDDVMGPAKTPVKSLFVVDG
ncbi:hypothetical protein H4F44_25605, partial [Escherichia coli]|uniref:hypothetical protein n=1 Tax=Escherichia coli TaxID=562 RepID=UPI001981CC63